MCGRYYVEVSVANGKTDGETLVFAMTRSELTKPQPEPLSG